MGNKPRSPYSRIDWDWFKERRAGRLAREDAKPEYTAEQWAALAVKNAEKIEAARKRARITRRSRRIVRSNPEGNNEH